MYKSKSLLITLLLVLSHVSMSAKIAYLVLVNDSNKNVEFGVKVGTKSITRKIMSGACLYAGPADTDELKVSYKKNPVLTHSNVKLDNLKATGDGRPLIVVRVLSGRDYSVIFADPGAPKIVRYTYTGETPRKEVLDSFRSYGSRKFTRLISDVDTYIREIVKARSIEEAVEGKKNLTETLKAINKNEIYKNLLGGHITFDPQALLRRTWK